MGKSSRPGFNWMEIVRSFSVLCPVNTLTDQSQLHCLYRTAMRLFGNHHILLP